MHEATRRLLGVLLRQLDGFDANKRSVVVGATNRMEDLDPALLSRWVAPSCLSSLYACMPHTEMRFVVTAARCMRQTWYC